MLYPVVIHHDEGSAYGVTVPDFPGTFSAGDSYTEALRNAKEAILGMLELMVEDGDTIPDGTDPGIHLEEEFAQGGTWALVEVDITPFLGTTQKYNITLPQNLVSQIDSQVGSRGRSSFLAEAAFEKLYQLQHP